MIQRFTLTDIHLAQINGEQFASASLTPDVAQQTPGLPGYGVGQQAAVHLSGVPAADVADWRLNDTIEIDARKVTA